MMIIQLIQTRTFINDSNWMAMGNQICRGKDFVGLIEWIGLVGGIEKGLFLPSVSALMGIRRANGFEIAAGLRLHLQDLEWFLQLVILSNLEI